jgi:hypothetical protein
LYTVRLSIDTTRVAGALSLSKIRYGFDGALHLEGKCLARHASPARLSSVACFVDMVISPLLRESVMPRKMTVKPGLFQWATIFICCARKTFSTGTLLTGPLLWMHYCAASLGRVTENTPPTSLAASRSRICGRKSSTQAGFNLAAMATAVRSNAVVSRSLLRLSTCAFKLASCSASLALVSCSSRKSSAWRSGVISAGAACAVAPAPYVL